MLSIALPFVIIRFREVKAPRGRFWLLVSVFIILAASLATQRKTAIVAPIAAFAVLIAYNRRLLRWAPLALLAAVPAIHFAAPGALGTFDVLANANSSDSTEQRIRDYSGVAPDIFSYPVLGRGYGTLDTDNSRWYRILDNEYLGELFQVGFVGLLAYLAMVLAPLISAHGVIKRARARGSPLLTELYVIAAAAGCAAFGVVSATYDALTYPQAPYSFLFAAGVIAATAATDSRESAVAPGTSVTPALRTPRGPYLGYVPPGPGSAVPAGPSVAGQRLALQRCRTDLGATDTWTGIDRLSISRLYRSARDLRVLAHHNSDGRTGRRAHMCFARSTV